MGSNPTAAFLLKYFPLLILQRQEHRLFSHGLASRNRRVTESACLSHAVELRVRWTLERLGRAQRVKEVSDEQWPAGSK